MWVSLFAVCGSWINAQNTSMESFITSKWVWKKRIRKKKCALAWMTLHEADWIHKRASREASKSRENCWHTRLRNKLFWLNPTCNAALSSLSKDCKRTLYLLFSKLYSFLFWGLPLFLHAISFLLILYFLLVVMWRHWRQRMKVRMFSKGYSRNAMSSAETLSKKMNKTLIPVRCWRHRVRRSPMG